MARLSSVQDENIAPVKGNRMKQTKIFESDNDDSFDMNGGGGGDDDDSDFEEMVTTKKRKPVKSTAATTGTVKKPRKAPAKKKTDALKDLDNNSVVEASGDISSSSSGTSTPAPVSKTKSASDQYQKLSQLEHVLKRPDTYVGSVEHTETKMWVFDQQTESMKYKEVTICPGLFKIFDEILVNAADNKIRDPSMDTLNVEINEETNTISVYNNGKGIPIEIHSKEKMYIPELIFGNLLTSSNYDDDEKKVTGGRNGYGAKLCNIFSTEFTVETADANIGKKYTQTWSQNMTKVGKAKIVNSKKNEQYTKITFKPDLKLFGMEKLDADILGVMKRRVYDLCGTVKDVKVSLNKQRLKVRNFKGYVEMFVKALQEDERANLEGLGDGGDGGDGNNSGDDGKVMPVPITINQPKPTIVHERINDRWEIAFAISDGNSFNQVSFVNSIATTSGGTHVSYISDQIANKILDHVKKKNKSAPLRVAQIKNNMFVFINCLIDNPAFTSQTKEQLTTKAASFGSKCILPNEFIAKILKTSIIQSVQDIASRNADKELKKQDGGKKKRITGFVKLEDANKAGTRESHKCTLVLTEGDSAMALAVAGLAVVGRDYYGVFPLRGKLLNVRDASHEQIMKNAEIQAIKQIMGLQHKKHYPTVDGLRYGHIMIMTDQDHDGSHIKGLIINFLDASFPGLLAIPGFLVEFITPIVKVSVLRGKKVVKVIPFYTMPQYEEWRDTEGKTCIWRQKYYKGLGTSEPNTEGREYFTQLDKHLKTFHQLQEEEKPLIELAFAKRNADARKDWLRALKPGTHLDPDLTTIPIGDFINKELILYSMADNIRSIPSVMDGFKPGQRKILYGCFKRNLVNEIKVAQLGGYVSENTGYHHGEQSLYQTIIGLAQDFVGSNNLYFLMPNGSFGSRASGGKDASAPRYIFTELNPLTRKIFHPSDDPLLKYMEDDDSTVEPEWYAPIIPTVLINGAEGIGTGWSTNIPCYNPLDLVENIKRLMNNEELKPMIPWYRGWTGSLERESQDKFKVTGTIEQIDDTTIEITELPIKMWTLTMKEYLLDSIYKGSKVDEKGSSKEFIDDMTEEHGTGIKFVITLNKTQMEKANREGLHKKFKLQTSLSIGNMVAFDPQGRLKKYESPEQILSEFYYVRLELYQKRKDYMANELKNQLEKISHQARFIKLIIEKKLVISNRRRQELVSQLEELKFPRFGKDGSPVYNFESNNPDLTEISVVLEEIEEDEGAKAVVADANKPSLANYDYLLGMAIWALTRERYEKLLKQRDDKEEELTKLLKLSAKDLWNNDLDVFVQGWEQFCEEDREKRESRIPDKKGKKRVTRKKPVKKDSDDDDFLPKELTKGKKATTTTTTNPTTKYTADKKGIQTTIQTTFKPPESSTPKKTNSLFGKGLFGSPIKKDDYEADADDIVNSFTTTTKKFSFGSPTENTSSIKTTSIFSLDSDEEDFEEVKPKVTTTSKVPTKSTITKVKAAPKPSVTKAKAVSKPPPKSSKIIELSDEEENDSEIIAQPAKARPSRRAATKKAVYTQTIFDSDEEDSMMVDDDDDDEDDKSAFISDDDF